MNAILQSLFCLECFTADMQNQDIIPLMQKSSLYCHSNPIGSIQTALEQFFREEGIEYACGECDCKQAIVTHKFTKLPRVIIIHLKRYKFDADAFQYSKLRRRILIPRYLSVHYHCTKETQSPTSLPKSLVNGTSSPRPQQLNAERTQRLSLTAPSTRESNWSASVLRPLRPQGRG
ncbi:ubiquitin carboxyl-terminal hydrolase 37-like [Asterias rubens]|uniref:ubiquitin carboxyl-terminal hydrolase 37-like n=1 Tax=Asterias rubens TaxID=7604 RepID=UPI001455A556|nr:ubiquitin carboxyl-terminal hydrolase 37-like [Asterias rubens]